MGTWGAVRLCLSLAAALVVALCHCVACLSATAQNSRLLFPPLVEPGKPVWVSVYDQSGACVPQASVWINGVETKCDDSGICNFTAPTDGDLQMSLAGGSSDSEVQYSRTAAGYLVSEAKLADVCDAIESVAGGRAGPVVYYVPSLVERNEPFLLLGRNFSGKLDYDRVRVDGLDAELFAGSTLCLLARTGSRVQVGPLREVYVIARDESSPSLEVDVCRLQLDQPDSADKLRIRLVGTNMPALLEAENLCPALLDLDFNGRRLGKTSTLVAPGGEINGLDLSLVPHTPVAGETVQIPEVRVLSDPLLAQAWHEPCLADVNVAAVLKSLYLDQASRLKRRLMALEMRLQDNNHKRENPVSNALGDQLLAESRALSVRKERLTTALAVRQAMMPSVGATSEEYAVATDTGLGGAGATLESQLSKLDLAGAAILARSDARRRKKQQAQEALLAGLQSPVVVASGSSRRGRWQRVPALPPNSGHLVAPPAPYKPDPSQLRLMFSPDFLTSGGNLGQAQQSKSKSKSPASSAQSRSKSKHGRVKSAQASQRKTTTNARSTNARSTNARSTRASESSVSERRQRLKVKSR